MNYVVCWLSLLLATSGFAAQSPRAALPQDVISVIQAHQPSVTLPMITEKYDWTAIQKQYPGVKLDESTATYSKKASQIIWQLNDKKEVSFVTFKFDLSRWKSTGAERDLLKKYKEQLSPEAFSKVPSDRRTLTVKDEKSGFEMDVYFPVSHYENPMIRSITVRLLDGDK